MNNDILKNGLDILNIEYNDFQLKQTDSFYEMLIEKNKVMNLTRITGKEDFYIKHILDSLLITRCISISKQKMIDIGTGAGFPGVPIKIFFPDVEMVLVDSLNKRLNFINEVIDTLHLNSVKTIHGRAEDLGHDKTLRESFDLCTSRAVADLPVLSELCIPFVKTEGIFAAYKSIDSNEEISRSGSAINKLSSSILRVADLIIPETDIHRNIVLIKKTGHISKKYPRSPKSISNNPL